MQFLVCFEFTTRSDTNQASDTNSPQKALMGEITVDPKGVLKLLDNLKGKARIPTDDLIPKTWRGRNQHSMAFQIPSTSKDVYKYSCFPQTIRDWNDLPESLISSSELSDDSESKFTSLVRTRD